MIKKIKYLCQYKQEQIPHKALVNNCKARSSQKVNAQFSQYTISTFAFWVKNFTENTMVCLAKED